MDATFRSDCPPLCSENRETLDYLGRLNTYMDEQHYFKRCQSLKNHPLNFDFLCCKNVLKIKNVKLRDTVQHGTGWRMTFCYSSLKEKIQLCWYDLHLSLTDLQFH